MKKISSKFESKPSYYLYNYLWYTLEAYLIIRIDSYIFFKYYNWDVTVLNNNLNNLKQQLSIKDITVIKLLHEYDYKVFKVLLFLYWDLECYLENKDYAKNSLKVSVNLNFLIIKFNKEIKSYKEFLNLISIRKSKNLWTHLEMKGMWEQILKYEIYLKTASLDTKYKKHSKIKTYTFYKKYNDLISVGIIYYIRAKCDKIDPLYNESYIEDWYKEWSSELNVDASLKYKEKIKNLDIELKELLKSLNVYEHEV